MPKDSLGILKLGSNDLIKIARIKSFAFPKKASNVLVYLSDKEAADTTKKKKPTKEDTDSFFADEHAVGASKGVTDYQLSEDGNYLLYISTGIKKDSTTKAGVYLYDILKDQNKHISSGKGTYKNLAFDELAKQ